MDSLFSFSSYMVFLIGFVVGYLFSIDFHSRKTEKALFEEISLLFSSIFNKDIDASLKRDISKAKKSFMEVSVSGNRAYRIELYQIIKFSLVSSDAQLEQLLEIRNLHSAIEKNNNLVNNM